jgi:PilZ domain
MSERRRSPRQPRLNGAKIICNGKLPLIDCIVRDVSRGGAQLIVASPVGIPDLFELRMNRNGARHWSKVAWRSKDRIGLTFIDPP